MKDRVSFHKDGTGVKNIIVSAFIETQLGPNETVLQSHFRHLRSPKAGVNAAHIYSVRLRCL